MIIGAGEYGHLVRELAEDCGYEKIAFLDDGNDEAVGKIYEYVVLGDEYQEFIVAIGNPDVRRSVVEKLRECYEMATIVHPLAYVSKTAVIGAGSVVEPGVVVYTNAKVGEACLLNAGAVVNHDGEVGSYCQLGCNSVVLTRAQVTEGTKVDHGAVVR